MGMQMLKFMEICDKQRIIVVKHAWDNYLSFQGLDARHNSYISSCQESLLFGWYQTTLPETHSKA